MSILSNPIVSTIVLGLPSGLLVNWLWQKFLDVKTKKEYLLKVESSNREVEGTLKSELASGNEPSYDHWKIIINATARKHKVNVSDMHNVTEAAENIFKDIADTSFLSSAVKNETYSKLDDIILIHKTTELIDSASKMEGYADKYNSSRYESISYTAVSFLITISFAIFSLNYKEFSGATKIFNDSIFNIVLVVLALTFTLISLLYLSLNFRKYNLKNDSRNQIGRDISKQ